MSKATGDGTKPSSSTPSIVFNDKAYPGSNAGPSRIVGSQAKKLEEVTRQGTQKMKFVPTLPVRRKKPDPQAQVKQEEVTAPSTPSKSIERGRGRGRGLGRGRGGPPPTRPEMKMTASGPFAMGPALAGSSKRRVPRSNFTPVMPMGPGSTSLVGDGISRTGAPVLGHQREKSSRGPIKEEEDIEVYSDPDEGVQIVDMDAVKTMDWMAPESLRRERDDGKRLKKQKQDAAKQGSKGKATSAGTVEAKAEAESEKNLANALDLSESEEEEEMEDLVEDFAIDNLDIEDEESVTRQEKLYFFQFPQPFPTFSSSAENETTDLGFMTGVDQKHTADEPEGSAADKGKKVSFAEDVKPPAPDGSQSQQEEKAGRLGDGIQDETTTASPSMKKKLDGVIGQLEVHRSGMIKMRLNNGMLMDVTAATQPSFLQHAVFLDPTAKKLHVLGEVNRRFVVSPDVDKLLEEINKAGVAGQEKVESSSFSMNIS